MSIEDIMSKVAEFGAKYVTVTGGEPLAQKECLVLLNQLCDAGYQVSLETGGAIDTTGVDDRVAVILDIKTPGSGELENNVWSNIQRLKPLDEVKFVLCDHADYQWAKQLMDKYAITKKCSVLFSPVYNQVNLPSLPSGYLLISCRCVCRYNYIKYSGAKSQVSK